MSSRKLRKYRPSLKKRLRHLLRKITASSHRSRRARRRRRRLLWGLAACLLVLAVGLPVAWLWVDRQARRQIEASIMQLSHQRALLPESFPGQGQQAARENAWPVYQALFKIDFSEEGEMRVPPTFAGLAEQHFKLLGAYGPEAPPAVKREMRRLYQQPSVIRALDSLYYTSRFDYCQFPEGGGVGPEPPTVLLGMHYRGVRLVVGRAMLSAEQGQVDEAMVWFAIALRLVRHLSDHPSLLAQLYQYTLQTFVTTKMQRALDPLPVPSAAASETIQVIQNTALNPPLMRALSHEVDFTLELFQMVNTDPWSARGLMRKRAELLHPKEITNSPGHIYLSKLGRPLRLRDQYFYLEVMERARPLLARPFREVREELQALGMEVENARIARWFGAMTPGLTRGVFTVSMKRDAAQAELTLAVVALALKGFKYEKGRYPKNLYELEQAVAWSVPRDPFTGQRFMYRPRGEGFLLYSLGPDLDNDQGKDTNILMYTSLEDGDISWEATR